MTEHQSIIGLYDSHETALLVQSELKQAGFTESDIEIINGSGLTAGTNGLHQRLRSWGLPDDDASHYADDIERGKTLLAVDAEEHEVPKAVKVMRVEEIEGTAGTHTEPGVGRDVEKTIPVIEEELHVGKERVETGGVRVVRHTREQPVSEDVRLRDERIHVERHATDRPVTAADVENLKRGDIELTESTERAVVGKSARVVEEVEVGKHVEEHTEHIEDTVRRDDVEIEATKGREPPEVRP